MNEQMRHMLTAYVDGVLSPPERTSVEQQAQESAEIRELLSQLQADAAMLRALSRKSIPADISRTILQRGRAGEMSRAEVLRRRWRTQVRLQAAAVLFLAVSIGLVWLIAKGLS